MLETTDVTLSAFYGNAAAGICEITGQQLPHGPWLISVIDGDVDVRIVIPDGQITERGDVVIQNGDAMGFPATVTAFPDSNQVKAYMYYELAS